MPPDARDIPFHYALADAFTSRRVPLLADRGTDPNATTMDRLHRNDGTVTARAGQREAYGGHLPERLEQRGLLEDYQDVGDGLTPRILGWIEDATGNYGDNSLL